MTVILYIIGAFVDVPYWVGLIISVLVAGFAGIGCIVTDNARDVIEEIDVKTSVSTKTITKFSNDIADILDTCKNDAVKEPLQKLVTKFKFSDPVSSPATEEKERIIETELEKLRGLISSDDEKQIMDQIEVVSNALSSRNRICESAK